ncbi:hypothetical protein [Bradyrhizobium ottawaense]|uniref:DUF4376 domain-containing protein n=1 Tax=Bradyrhizobium ottawaense TaxID=931866 RepID=A0ABY0QH46_9BRAD|nr:hypothetical protein [Bradyrhizobium ottawaense]SDK40086.1 hypothetical protein SAMN05444163_8025 [Bradyrhizobium ottawaense]
MTVVQEVSPETFEQLIPGSSIRAPDGSLQPWQAVELWTSDELAAIGVFIVDDPEIPVGKVMTGMVFSRVDGKVSAAPVLNDIPPPPPPPVPTLTRRQMLIGLSSAGLITAQEAIDSAKMVGVPTAVQAVIDSLPMQEMKDQATITWFAMSQVVRSDPMVEALRVNANLTAEQVDGLFFQWASL